MGGKSMNQVIDWLANTKVALKGWDAENHVTSPDIKRIRKLDGSDLALMLTIASRQMDEEPDSVWSAKECFCIGSEKELESISQLRQWKFRESRAFLQFMKLISYNKSEEDCIDLTNNRRRRKYKNVYRLNAPLLASLKTATKETEGKVAVDEKLVANSGKVGDQLQKSCPPTTDYKEESQKRSSKKKGAAATKDDPSERAELYRQYIVLKWGLAEQQGATIGLEGLVAGTAQKPPEKVREVIDGFSHDDRLQKPNKLGSLIGSLIKKLKVIPKTSEALPKPEELEKQFSPAAPVPEPQDVLEARKKYHEAWKRLVDEQNLTDVTDEALMAELKAAFKETFGSQSLELLNCDLATFFELLPKPDDDVRKRCEAIKACLEEVTPQK